MEDENKVVEEVESGSSEPQYSLNDDRRVKVLSPGRLVAKRFFRNRIAVIGMVILIFMFAFSFLGGVISPYRQDEYFYKIEAVRKAYATVTKNVQYRYTALSPEYNAVIQAQSLNANNQGKDSFSYGGKTYGVVYEGHEFYSVTLGNEMIGFAYQDIVNTASGVNPANDYLYAALKAYSNEESSFEYEGKTYEFDDIGNILLNGELQGFVGRYIVSASSPDVVLTQDFKDRLLETIEEGKDVFKYTDESGTEAEYDLTFDPSKNSWSVLQYTETTVFDRYSPPSKEHWLGTDGKGMDMMTRLMYGGRVSLVIGFIVEIISTVIGVIMGGISGYFGGWVDNLIMRIVDVFYCVPSLPLIIILGAAMDHMHVESQLRMLYLMLILGFLGWPGMARMVRGLILSLREQEFMTAAEATGLSVNRRIFKHLVPNVIPQLIVSMTMGLGGTIITEATLSFLGLGVKFPFASWGNIINDVNNTFVLTHYWFIWIPAGVLLLLTVLAFNLVGDGLRDAFDPKMKR
ncbi:MAG: ABC transporter permease [Erysipelotrichales bacterium]|nr:ABC transporter permease [Erysipelotrichales bacterium]